MSVALPDEDDVTQWDVAQWVRTQGEHLSPTQMTLLYYLSLSAFYSKDNPEDAKVGEVLYAASSYRAISAGTGIRSNTTIREALNSMQEAGFILRDKRTGRGSDHAPLRIRVVWGESFDEYREALRDDASEVHPRFLIHPRREQKLAPVRALRQVDVTTG